MLATILFRQLFSTVKQLNGTVSTKKYLLYDFAIRARTGTNKRKGLHNVVMKRMNDLQYCTKLRNPNGVSVKTKQQQTSCDEFFKTS